MARSDPSSKLSISNRRINCRACSDRNATPVREKERSLLHFHEAASCELQAQLHADRFRLWGREGHAHPAERPAKTGPGAADQVGGLRRCVAATAEPDTKRRVGGVLCGGRRGE